MKVSVLALVVLLFAVACDKGEKTPAAGAKAASSAAAPGAAPEIKVLDAGKDPKKALRFTPKKDAKQTMVMSMDMTMAMNMAGNARTQQIPTVEMTMDATVTDVTASGDIRFGFALTEVKVVESDPSTAPMVSAMQTATSGMVGLSGTALVTSRGFTKEIEIKAPPNMNPQIAQFLDSLKQSMSQMMAPLPEEPVGPGAKWETKTSVAQGGIKLSQVATTELSSLEGDVATLTIKLAQTAPHQTINKDGMTAELESYTGSGNGTSTLNLTQIVPTAAKVAMKSQTDLSSAGQRVSLGIEATIGMTTK